MQDRLKYLRKAKGLTQQEFADRLKIKRNTIAKYETGRGEPIDAVIALIVREFNVNEVWLRTGEGEMFMAKTEDEEIAAFVGGLLSSKSESFKRRFIHMITQLDEADWAVLERMADKMKKD